MNGIREYLLGQVKIVNEVMQDIVKHDASKEVLEHAKEFCELGGSEENFIRVEYGGAYAYLDIEEGKPVGNPVWWNNKDLGCDGCGYEETIRKLEEMTDEEILNTTEAGFIDEDDYLDIPVYVPFSN